MSRWTVRRLQAEVFGEIIERDAEAVRLEHLHERPLPFECIATRHDWSLNIRRFHGQGRSNDGIHRLTRRGRGDNRNGNA